MKIDNLKSTVSAVGSGVPRPRADSTLAAGSSAEPSAQVQISSLASLLDNAPVTNSGRIAEIKQAIAEGRFTVNAEKIADGLLSSVRQLLDKSGSNA